jgi:hypothetical protein
MRRCSVSPKFSVPPIPPHEVVRLEKPDPLGVGQWAIWWLSADGEPTGEEAAAVYVAEGYDGEKRVAFEQGATPKGWNEHEDVIQGLDNYEDGQPAAIIELDPPVPLSRFGRTHDEADPRLVRTIEVRCSGPRPGLCPKRPNADYFVDCFLEGGGEVHLWSRDPRWTGLEPTAPLGAPVRFGPPDQTSNAEGSPVKGPRPIPAEELREGDFTFVKGRLFGRVTDVVIDDTVDDVFFTVQDMSNDSPTFKVSRSQTVDIERFEG